MLLFLDELQYLFGVPCSVTGPLGRQAQAATRAMQLLDGRMQPLLRWRGGSQANGREAFHPATGPPWPERKRLHLFFAWVCHLQHGSPEPCECRSREATYQDAQEGAKEAWDEAWSLAGAGRG